MDSRTSPEDNVWTDTESFHDDDELDLHEIAIDAKSKTLGHQALLNRKSVIPGYRKTILWRYIPFIAHLLLFTTSLTMLLAALTTYQYNAEHECGEIYGTYFDIHVNEDYGERFFDDSLDSPYRGPPTPDVEKRWSDLHNISYRLIDFDELYESGGPADSVRYFEDAYPANLAAFHQMHCLTILWQHTWLDWYGDNIPDIFAKDTPQLIHDHLDHCADILRQALMCNPDTSSLVYRWNDKHEMVMNFGLPRRCRNYDAIVEWGKAKEWHKSDV